MDTRLITRKKQLENLTLLIQECQNSGTKTKDWLAQNNISKDQYYYWLRFVRENAYIKSKNRAAQINQVVRIECEYVYTSQNISTDTITISHGQLNISIPATIDVNTIRTIMEGLYMFNNATCFTSIYIVCGRTDLRYGIDSLVGVLTSLGIENPAAANTLYLFCGRLVDSFIVRIKGKIIFNDGNKPVYTAA